MAPPAIPRASATLVDVRDGAVGLEVLLLRRRTAGGDLYSDSWVFPGGSLDAADARAHGHCRGVDDVAASARLGVASGGLDYLVAAVRECFEEAGLLFGDAGNSDATNLATWRLRLQRGETDFAAFCAAAGVAIDADRLACIAHWLTPVGLPKRFDTRFFVAAAPAGQPALHDDNETVELGWRTAADALAERRALMLARPTAAVLEAIGRHADVAALMAWARGLGRIDCIAPALGSDTEGKRPVLPDHPAHAELRRIDPEGRGDGSCDIVPGRAVRLSPRVIRVSANNGSVMTGPGTNTYLVGGGPANRWAAIDPGPRDEAHVQAILAAAPGPIDRIFATHTHLDHSPACALLAARTGAPEHGRIADHAEWQDAGFAPQVLLAGGERFDLDGATLHVIHTPGHASNHLCYRLEEEKTLFTGDHLMQLSTVVINPPDGDMAAYLRSLRALLALELDWLAPGHGFLMAEPRRAIEAVIAHRLRRVAKVLAAVQALGPADEAALLARVYNDVPERMHPMALRSLRAHLTKLSGDGLAIGGEGGWRVA